MMQSGSPVDQPRRGKEKIHSCSLLKNSLLNGLDNKALVLVLIVMFFVLAPLDVPELIMAFTGAVMYALLMVLPKASRMQQDGCKASKRTCKVSLPKDVCNGPRRTNCSPKVRSSSTPAMRSSCAPAQPVEQPAAAAAGPGSKRDSKLQRLQKNSATVVPIPAPVFEVVDFNSQVDELVSQIGSTSESEKTIAHIVSIVKQALQPLLPEVEVCGFSCGGLGLNGAYGVAVPEVDIVANVTPAELTARLHCHMSRSVRNRGIASADLDTRRLQKSAIRECTSLLMGAGFKFRRSCFRSAAPKVTVMTPTSMGISLESVPFDFSVNNNTPYYGMAFFSECTLIEPRAKGLILLVRRWAKDRGICHASKGHLPPYVWSLLVIYFLQVGVTDEGALLPPLEDFAMVSALMAKRRGRPTLPRKVSVPPWRRQASQRVSAPTEHTDKPPKNSVGDLFKKFVHFYSVKMQWRKEAVSVRLGKRVAPNPDLKTHVVVNEDGTSSHSPIIEDPFDAKNNLSTGTNAMAIKRFHEELLRAKELMAKDEPLSTILELWRPFEGAEQAEGQAEPLDELEE